MSRFVQASRAQVEEALRGFKFARERELYSAVDIANNGNSPDGNAVFQFWRDNFARTKTNIKQPGKLTQDGIFVVEGMSFEVVFAGAGDVEQGSSLTLAALVAEAKRRYYESGYINAKIRSTEIIETLGLGQWPTGGGAHVDGVAVATTVAATSYVGAHVTNGVPHAMNKRMFKIPFVVKPTDTFEMIVDFGTVIALPANVTGKIIARLYGIEATSALAGG